MTHCGELFIFEEGLFVKLQFNIFCCAANPSTDIAQGRRIWNIRTLHVYASFAFLGGLLQVELALT
ncbi:MAG: hypothetical protein IT497_01010 [Ottowia sp.]|nr:hypothetical protein [Ottowia sp.]